jgi:hypothetical protein
VKAGAVVIAAGLLAILWASMARPADVSPAQGTSVAENGPRFLIELKREATSRGTPEETTKSQIKIDALLDGIVSLMRVELPFPDEKTSFEGDPFNLRLGDIKFRVGFRSFPVHDVPLGTFLEVTFPTADPEELGSGKYQLSPGIRATFPVSLGERLSESHRMSFEPLVKQVFSVAGDEERKDIHYTKFELSLKDTWRKEYWLKLTPNPVVDWEQDAKTGASASMRRWPFDPGCARL